MTFRSRKNETAYAKHKAENKTDGCPFCAFRIDDGQVVRETKYFWIAINLFPYDLWEGLDVIEQLMLVPKKHVDSMAHFSPEELKEHIELVAEYDTKGYSTYSRSVHNISKSVAHQHTHLLKLGTHHAKMSFYLQKPYILWFK